MATKNEIQHLYNRYLNNEISEKELEEFLLLLHTPEDELTVSKLMDGTWQEMFEVTPVRTMFPWKRIAAAAILILLLSVGGYMYFNKKSEPIIAKTEIKNDIAAPKATKAMITLANGKTVSIDSIANGTLATQGNVNVIKTADGKIIYNGTSNEAVYNTLTNPRGSKVVDITLADGSRVWLNAGSSVTYPVAFVGKERNVELNGDGYFFSPLHSSQ